MPRLAFAHVGSLLFTVILRAASLTTQGGMLQVEVGPAGESVQIHSGGGWLPVLSTTGPATRVVTAGAADQSHSCRATAVSQPSPSELLLRADCGTGTLEQRIATAAEPDVLDVKVRFVPAAGAAFRSVEDRYDFVPAKHPDQSPLAGPLDFVWSQNIKSEPDDLVSNYQFKSPAVMFQQGNTFAALLPKPDRGMPLALDLDVTSAAKPWFSYGAVVSQPHGHSYFSRSRDAVLPVANGAIEYSYSIVACVQPAKLGYRLVVRRLWTQLGHPELLASNDLQQNVKKPELDLFDEWRQDAWIRYANEVYRSFDCGGQTCGTLTSMRNVSGDWDKPAPDAWFNHWFQTLRTGYGWSLYGRNTHNAEIQRKAETVLNLALRSPRKDGAFSTIYLLDGNRWIPEDGWAGFPEDYHAFCMSWTAYWMLQWAKDLTPQRTAEIVAFVRPYGDFLVRHQLPSGVIPSWYRAADLEPRPEFRDFNAETAGSALFLLELAAVTRQQAYADSAKRAMEFVTREVLPRQRWSDFETFKSCARKSFDFFDRWTAQYPQNNLSTIQAAMAYLKLYQTTGEHRQRDLGLHVLDYLLLTQQVWNNLAFSPKLLGGFTTQNTDAEWSDARQCYGAIVLWQYYQETGELEYLERAVAAARSTFAVAPWENWAHTGYRDEHGALTGFHWGTGSAMTSVEIMAPMLGDAFIDLARKQGVGFNACSLRDVKVDGTSVHFRLDAAPRLHALTMRFAGVNPRATYHIAWNNHPPENVSGETLAKQGLSIRL
jgi:hypothetical protein